jgi:ABC-type lipoprotein export system ATPase subunit
MNTNAIELKDIKKEYNTLNEKLEVLKGINYSFEKGKLYAIKGHSGSGKTTLISILGLMDQSTSGDYILDGKLTKELNDIEKSSYRLNHIGFIFQDYNLNPYLNAEENIIIPMLVNKSISKKDRNNIALELLNKVGIVDRKTHFPRELSGGEQQRVAIARALANNPEILIADEPTGNLDKDNEKIIFSLLKKMADEGKCVIVVSHSDEINNYASVRLLLEDGLLKEVNNDK